MTKEAIDETRIVSTVEMMVIMAELVNTCQKFIFFMASGKFFKVNPCFPIRDRGSVVISAFVLNTLITTRINGAIKQMKRTSSTIHMIVFITFLLLAAFSFSVIMQPPPLSCRYKPA